MTYLYIRRWYIFFFFFKQKTAYEMPKRLEFRRVLFRSSGLMTGWALTRASFASVDHTTKKAWNRQIGTVAQRVHWRSEERRVGKESSARWVEDDVTENNYGFRTMQRLGGIGRVTCGRLK